MFEEAKKIGKDGYYFWKKGVFKTKEEMTDYLENLVRTYPIISIEDGISEEDFLKTLDEMSEQAFDDQCTGANPRYPLISEIKDIYLKVYYGGER